MVDLREFPFENFLSVSLQSVVGVAVTSKCLGGPLVDRNRRNVYLGRMRAPFLPSSVSLFDRSAINMHSF
ncbi:hypothetical protein TNCV_5056661 [Trichonephila clavipes]|nr:hypothetical protein TNCV_5056661 [Trichonephila clavipes]